MYFDDVNWIAIISVAILNIILGALWYSPQVFGKIWMNSLGIKEGECQAHCSVNHYLGAFAIALVTAWVLALFINWIGAITAIEGAKVGFFVWLGFIATTHFSGVLWVKKPLKTYLIDAGFYLVNFVLAGAILAAWQ